VGLEFNHLFGFGVLDAGAMVALAKQWKTVPARWVKDSLGGPKMVALVKQWKTVPARWGKDSLGGPKMVALVKQWKTVQAMWVKSSLLMVALVRQWKTVSARWVKNSIGWPPKISKGFMMTLSLPNKQCQKGELKVAWGGPARLAKAIWRHLPNSENSASKVN
jgi:hypothetical protein